ncbi:GtrA family protein [Endozoicomonas sp.]|uniref:GtrA family protein n=1 Tax=Endozoicomonas sp. TaxID=1892382 RepID=UPI0028847938|nr:GtrA family protein [Endozoicomonas sp.]
MLQRILNSKRAFKFVLVGGVGFLVDVFLFSLCLHIFSMNTLAARIAAFIGAATITWAGNRLLTFNDRQQRACWQQWQKHMVTACFSAMPNFVVFQLYLSVFGDAVSSLYIAMMLGIAAGMCSNYLLSLHWVYAKRVA